MKKFLKIITITLIIILIAIIATIIYWIYKPSYNAEDFGIQTIKSSTDKDADGIDDYHVLVLRADLAAAQQACAAVRQGHAADRNETRAAGLQQTDYRAVRHFSAQNAAGRRLGHQRIAVSGPECMGCLHVEDARDGICKRIDDAVRGAAGPDVRHLRGAQEKHLAGSYHFDAGHGVRIGSELCLRIPRAVFPFFPFAVVPLPDEGGL